MPCCFRKLFGGFSTFCALARPSTCKHSRVGREPGRVLERDLAAQGPRTFLHAGGNGRVLEHERAAQRPRTFVQLAGRMQNKPHSRRLRACYLQLTQAGQRTKPDSTRRLPRGRPLLKRCHIFCSAWNNTTASAVSFLSQLHHGNKSRPIVLVQAFGAMQKQYRSRSGARAHRLRSHRDRMQFFNPTGRTNAMQSVRDSLRKCKCEARYTFPRARTHTHTLSCSLSLSLSLSQSHTHTVPGHTHTHTHAHTFHTHTHTHIHTPNTRLH